MIPGEDNKVYPTIYYTTTDGKQLDTIDLNSFFLRDNILTHTQEPNGEWKIVCKDTLTAIPNGFCTTAPFRLSTIRFEHCEKITSIGYGFFGLTYPNNRLCDFSGLSNVNTIGDDFMVEVNCSSFIFPSNVFTSAISDILGDTGDSYITSLTLLGNEVHEALGEKFTLDRINPDLKIYVPHELVEAYKERFPQLADRIYCILKENCSEHFEWPIIDYPAVMYTTTNDQPLSLGISGETDQEKIGRVFVHKFSSETITIPTNFLFQNTQLERIKFNNVKHSTMVIPAYFGSSWSNSIEIDLSVFSECKSIGSYFLASTRCKNDIDFSPLNNIQNISTGAFASNYILNIDLQNIIISSVINQFLYSPRVLQNLYINSSFAKNISETNFINLNNFAIQQLFDDVKEVYPEYDKEIHQPYVWLYGEFVENIDKKITSCSGSNTSQLLGTNSFHLLVPCSEYVKYANSVGIYYIKYFLYCMEFPEGIYSYEKDTTFIDTSINMPLKEIFKEKCDYNVTMIVNNELVTLTYHYSNDNALDQYYIENEQDIILSFFTDNVNNTSYFMVVFEDNRNITSLHIRCVEPVKSHINWQVASGTWNPSSNSDAVNGIQYTCVSPGTNAMTRIRCYFLGLRSITFAFRSDAESNYDYLIVGQVDVNLQNVITSWSPSSVYNNANVVTSTRGKQGQWLTYTFVTNTNEHFVDFIFGKDPSTDTQPDNAQVYVSAIMQ